MLYVPNTRYTLEKEEIKLKENKKTSKILYDSDLVIFSDLLSFI